MVERGVGHDYRFMGNTNTSLRNSLLRLAGTLTLSLTAIAALVANSGDAATVLAADGNRAPDLTVTRLGSSGFDMMMPGDRVTLSYEVSADIAVVYAFSASVSGAESLAIELRADVATPAGATLYSGPLDSAAFGSRALVAGQSDVILIEVYLPLDATVGGPADDLNLAAEFTAARA